MDTIEEAFDSIQEWKSKRKEVIAPTETHLIHRPAFNTNCLREAAFYRLLELSESAYHLYKSSHVVGSVVCARSSQETLSVLWYINSKLIKLNNDRDLEHYLHTMKRLTFGRTDDSDFPDKINILTCIDSVDKRVELGFRRNYDILSEYAHPNYSGTLGVYSNPIENPISTVFGTYPRTQSNLYKIIESTIIACLIMIEPLYTEYVDLISDLTNLCKELNSKDELHDIFYK